MKFRTATPKLFLAMMASLAIGVPGDALTLQGTVRQTNQQPAKPTMSRADLTSENATAAKAKAQVLEGNWFCTTQVTKSSAVGVTPGTSVQCVITYKRDRTGNLVETWAQSEWAPAVSAVVKIDATTMSVTHTSSYAGARAVNQSARSTDTMQLVSANTMVAQSVVAQYLNGRYVGLYETASVLKKAG